jgi:alpha-tubulin suppressor-like RCC1 family protein
MAIFLTPILHTSALSRHLSELPRPQQDERIRSPTGKSFQQITAGASHTCGLLTDSTVACWGDDSEHQTDASTDDFWSIS